MWEEAENLASWTPEPVRHLKDRRTEKGAERRTVRAAPPRQERHCRPRRSGPWRALLSQLCADCVASVGARRKAYESRKTTQEAVRDTAKGHP